MKKAYMIPFVEVVKTETEELICVSVSYGQDYTGGEILENDDFENVFEDLW